MNRDPAARDDAEWRREVLTLNAIFNATCGEGRHERRLHRRIFEQISNRGRISLRRLRHAAVLSTAKYKFGHAVGLPSPSPADEGGGPEETTKMSASAWSVNTGGALRQQCGGHHFGQWSSTMARRTGWLSATKQSHPLR